MPNVHKFPIQQAVCRPTCVPINNEPLLKPGFIFIALTDEQSVLLPREYILSRLGSMGFYGKIDPEHINGYEAIPFLAYHPNRG